MNIDKTAPDGHVARAVDLAQQEKMIRITAELDAAKAADPEHWPDILVPRPPELLRRVFSYRYSPVMTPASLYPAKSEQ